MRYVDNKLTVWKNPTEINNLAKAFNLEEYGITLKKDQKCNSKLHYLDLDIAVQDSKLKTNIYRKPMYQPVLMPNWSHDPVNYKKSAFKSFYKRASAHCEDKKFLDQELAYIEKIGLQHGYTINRSFLRQIWKEVRKNAHNQQHKQEKITAQQNDYLLWGLKPPFSLLQRRVESRNYSSMQFD